MLVCGGNDCPFPVSPRTCIQSKIPVFLAMQPNADSNQFQVWPLPVSSHIACTLSDLFQKHSHRNLLKVKQLTTVLSIIALSPNRSVSTRPKLGVLLGCLCNLFMTVQVLLMLMLVMLARDTETARTLHSSWKQPI